MFAVALQPVTDTLQNLQPPAAPSLPACLCRF